MAFGNYFSFESALATAAKLLAVAIADVKGFLGVHVATFVEALYLQLEIIFGFEFFLVLLV